ncbi:MAG: protein-disulfide reductase DsbD family protein, partial [Gammaproteobacteria bacterium]|nr:protein-disulfide reductase DsbD family protein [Gammaproteobacteria bacterium]
MHGIHLRRDALALPERGRPALELLRGLLVALAFGAAQAAAAAELDWLDEEPEFLPVDEAFALSTETAEDGALLAYWDMPDGYYLYRHRFDFALKDPEAATLGAAELPPGKDKVDEYFGAVEVYYHRVQARVPIRNAQGPVEV